jgi:hypothetical protein
MDNNKNADYSQPASGDMKGFQKVMDQASKPGNADAAVKNNLGSWNDVTKNDAKNGQCCK